MTEDTHAALLNSTVSDHFAGLARLGWGPGGGKGWRGEGEEEEGAVNYIGWLPASHAQHITCAQTQPGRWIQRIDS